MFAQKVRGLLASDCRQMLKDPMLMACIIGPILLIAMARFGLPALLDWIEYEYEITLYAYTSLAAIFLLTIIPVLIGSLAGLLMLDERDEKLIAYFEVTPLTRDGYFRFRIWMPSLLGLITIGLFIGLSGIAEARLISIYAVVLLVLEAPLIAMFLAAFASNKVEGLALSKAAGLLFTGPIIAYFAPKPWSYLGVWIPTYWPAQSYLTGIRDEGGASLGWFVGGLGLHIVLLLSESCRVRSNSEGYEE
ncbi:hypothetical protein ACX1C1_06890 [Paenibacillus sp. strain BS8-2]